MLKFICFLAIREEHDGCSNCKEHGRLMAAEWVFTRQTQHEIDGLDGQAGRQAGVQPPLSLGPKGGRAHLVFPGVVLLQST